MDMEYSRYCYRLNEYLKYKDLSMHLEYQAGDMMMIDFAGKKQHYVDTQTGERIDCQLFTYFNMNQLIEKVTLPKLDGSYIKLLNHLERQALIILDDFGLLNLGQDMRVTLLQLLEDRYGKKRIITTSSQLPVAKWYEYINDPTLADAILDRRTANAHGIELKGESLRRKKRRPIINPLYF